MSLFSDIIQRINYERLRSDTLKAVNQIEVLKMLNKAFQHVEDGKIIKGFIQVKKIIKT